MTRQFVFGADSRLKKRSEFRRVFEEGQKTVGRALIVWHRYDSARNGSRLGLSVSAKVGNAVKRNRLKRLLRESFRLRQRELAQGCDVIAYPRPGCSWKTRIDAEADLLGLLRRTGRLRS
ncbi:MAG: ribonuclease P protein component [Elusimicrobiota bacterium]